MRGSLFLGDFPNNTLQHTATHCNTLQHTATYCIHSNRSACSVTNSSRSCTDQICAAAYSWVTFLSQNSMCFGKHTQSMFLRLTHKLGSKWCESVNSARPLILVCASSNFIYGFIHVGVFVSLRTYVCVCLYMYIHRNLPDVRGSLFSGVPPHSCI